MPHDIFDTFATHASTACDVTDTDCLAQNGSTHACASVTFKPCFFHKQGKISTFNLKNETKRDEIYMGVYFLFYSY